MNVPACVTFAIAPLCELVQDLPAAEAESLGPQAGERRRKEFAAGRALARKLLSAHGHGGHALTQNAAGVPQWPDGITGSISHCRDLAFVAIAATGEVAAIGIDIEDGARFHDRLADDILTPAELARLPGEDGARRQQMGIIFSTKEAFYKNQFSLFGEKLSFQDAEIHLHPRTQTSTIVMTDPERHDPLAANVRGHYAVSGTHVAAMVLRNPA